MFALSARWILPISRPPLEDGYVTIDGPRIVAVSRERPTCPVTELGDVALLPGLINCHTHLEFSGLQQPLGRAKQPLPEWIREVITHRDDYQQGDAAVHAGLRESLKSGVTTIGEIATEPFSLEPITDAAPQRATVFREFIAFDKARQEAIAGEVAKHAQFNWTQDVQPGISPHAPYTVHQQVFAELVSQSACHRLPLAMHLAESCEELELLQAGTGPFRQLLDERDLWQADLIAPSARPLDYLQQLSAAQRSLVIHGNYLDQDEIEFLAAQRERMSIVYCPRTHAYFGHQPYPLAKMLQAGVNVALGTDSRASNPDLSLLAEMRHIARAGQISPEEILKFGTLNGARALGDEDAGVLLEGRRADLFAVELPGQVDDIYETILGGSGQVPAVYLAGVEVGRKGENHGDAEDLSRQSRNQCKAEGPANGANCHE